MARADRGSQVYPIEQIPRLDVAVLERLRAKRAGGVHEPAEPAECCRYGIERACGRVRLGEIHAADHERIAERARIGR